MRHGAQLFYPKESTMVGRPRKALLESQLVQETAGSAVVREGSHDNFKVTFIEDGRTYKGFYKKIDPEKNYPELLAKISVAVSLLKRTFQGQRSAEERLVFNKENVLCGTVSIAVENFKPFSFLGETIKPQDQDVAIPSTKTLVIKQFIKILFGRWLLDDDDGHPHNMSLEGDIDFDMFLYWFTIWMKEPRPFIGVQKKEIKLTVADWERFPVIKDSKAYHWPTYSHPGQESISTYVPGQGQILTQALPKGYANPSQFEALAGDKQAQEQKLAAALTALLTYQPDVLRKRLVALFGDLPFNYKCLGSNLSAVYEKEYPDYCKADTNNKPFVDFIMAIYQKHYDSLYRVVVFYKGCANNGFSLSQLATHEALYRKPSFYQDIVSWVQEENKNYKGEDADLKLDLNELKLRYHQVWRDAFGAVLRDLLHDSYRLTNRVILEVTTLKEAISVVSIDTNDTSVTEVWHLFGNMPQLSRDSIESLISVDKASSLREAVLLLIDFSNQFHDVVKSYYDKKRKDLSEPDNHNFVSALRVLHTAYNLKIRKSLANTTTDAKDFVHILDKLNRLVEESNFELHLTTNDAQMKQVSSQAPHGVMIPATDDEVLKQFTGFLFSWAKGLDANEFERHIKEIMKKYYVPLFPVSTRNRQEPVNAYLESSKKESNDIRLAFILSSGKEDGALNRLLVKHLTPLMLQIPAYALPSVNTLVQTEAFHKEVLDQYTKSAITHAKTLSDSHINYSSADVVLLYKTMYEWLKTRSDADFTGMVNAALKSYEDKISIWTTSRRGEVQEKFKKYGANKAKLIAMIFLEGGVETTSLNPILFNIIVSAIQKNIEANNQLNSPGYKLLERYNKVEHEAMFLQQIKENAKAPSSEQTKKVLELVNSNSITN